MMHVVSPNKKYTNLSSDSFFAPESMLEFIDNNEGFLPEADLIAFAKKEFSDSNKNFIDIGAHVGSYTFELADSFKHVHSFEPAQESYNYLCSNIAIKGLTSKTTTHNIALGSSKKKEIFCVRQIDGGTSGLPLFGDNNEPIIGDNEDSYLVNVDTLDSFELTNIGLIKIDVEGYELDVLKGSVNTLIKNNYPPILFESNGMLTGHPDLLNETFESAQKKLFVFLNDLGYSVSLLNKAEMYIARHKTSLQNLLEHFIKNPDDNLNKFWLGCEYENLGQLSSAMGYYLSCAENTNDDKLAYECLIRKAICFRAQGERETHVRNSLLLAVSLIPERPEAYYLLSQSYEISKDFRDEDKWHQAYAWARIGEKISKKFEVTPLLTKTPYHGDYLFSFQQAVSLWWVGRGSDSLKLFTQLKNNKKLDDRHKECVNYNLETLAMKQPTLNT